MARKAQQLEMVETLQLQVKEKRQKALKEHERYVSEKEEAAKLVLMNKQEREQEEDIEVKKKTVYKRELDAQLREKGTRDAEDVMTQEELKLNKMGTT